MKSMSSMDGTKLVRMVLSIPQIWRYGWYGVSLDTRTIRTNCHLCDGGCSHG
jgi:hypothetical protein